MNLHAPRYDFAYAGSECRMPRWKKMRDAFLASQLDRDRRHLDLGKSARHDRIESQQVDRDVECETMERDPTPNTDTDRSNLPFRADARCTTGPIDEDPRPARHSLCRYPQLVEGIDERRL